MIGGHLIPWEGSGFGVGGTPTHPCLSIWGGDKRDHFQGKVAWFGWDGGKRQTNSPPNPPPPRGGAAVLRCGRSFANAMTSSEGAVVFETLPEAPTPGSAPGEAQAAAPPDAKPLGGPRAVLYDMPKWVSESTIESKVEDLGVQVCLGAQHGTATSMQRTKLPDQMGLFWKLKKSPTPKQRGWGVKPQLNQASFGFLGGNAQWKGGGVAGDSGTLA